MVFISLQANKKIWISKNFESIFELETRVTYAMK